MECMIHLCGSQLHLLSPEQLANVAKQCACAHLLCINVSEYIFCNWLMWALCWAGLAPGLVCLIATPLILYVIYPPEQKDTPDAPEKARWVSLPWRALLMVLLQMQLSCCSKQGHCSVAMTPKCSSCLRFYVNTCCWHPTVHRWPAGLPVLVHL